MERIGRMSRITPRVTKDALATSPGRTFLGRAAPFCKEKCPERQFSRKKRISGVHRSHPSEKLAGPGWKNSRNSHSPHSRSKCWDRPDDRSEPNRQPIDRQELQNENPFSHAGNRLR